MKCNVIASSIFFYACYNDVVCDTYKWTVFPGTENLVLGAGETVVLEKENGKFSFFIKS